MSRTAEFIDAPSAVEPPEAVAPPDAVEPQSVAEQVLRLLEERGVPSGAWLVDIAQTRQALRDADTLLRRLEDAIIRSAA
jgi:hypothetical protein